MLDTWPAESYDGSIEGGGATPVNHAPPPWSTFYDGDNVECDLCVDTFTMMSLK